MATSKVQPTRSRRNRIAWIAIAVILMVACAAFHLMSGPAPQMGASPEVFKTVDALFTAIGNRDEKRLSDCESRLREANATGTLPAVAWEYLSDVISTAKAGQWRPAAESLYSFMMDQRREAENSSSTMTTES